MIGTYGALPGGWLNPVNVMYDAGSALDDWWNDESSSAPPAVGPSDTDYSPTQQITSPDLAVPRRIERPSQPQQSPVPGVTPAQYRQDPHQTVNQFPLTTQIRSRLPAWAPWAIGLGVFALLVTSATGAVAVKRKRRRRYVRSRLRR